MTAGNTGTGIVGLENSLEEPPPPVAPAPALAPATAPATTGRAKNTRSRSGCLNCRRRKRKCDERRPTCQGCARRNEACEWGLRVTFHSRNALSIVGDFPAGRSQRQHNDPYGRRRGRPIHSGPPPVNSLAATPPDSTLSVVPGFLPESRYSTSNTVTSPGSVSLLSASDRTFSLVDASLSEHSPGQGYGGGMPAAVTPSPSAPTALNTDNSVIASLVALRQGVGGGVAMAPPPYAIEASRSFEGDAFQHDYATAAAGAFPSPGPSLDDGIFRPGTAYHELHSTLRSHIIHEVRSNAPTRPGTPAGLGWPGGGSSERDREKVSGDKTAAAARRQPAVHETRNGDRNCLPTSWDAHETAGIPPLEWPAYLLPDDQEAPALSQQEEAALWTNWFEEIAPWLDKFDNQRHFQHALPIMARKSDSLRYAMLALSARQLERKEQGQEESTEIGADPPRDRDRARERHRDPDRNRGRSRGQCAAAAAASAPRRRARTDRSLALYQQAIHLLLPQLHARTTVVIAACVVLCVLEMMSCSPKAWKRHLDGCAALMQAVGSNGFVGGVEQALFWCFARMDVCGGLISSVRTLIPARLWATRIDLDADEGLFRSTRGFDMAANHAVYLAAQVLDLLYAPQNAQSGSPGGGATATTARELPPPESSSPLPPPLSSEAYRARWLKLWRYLEDWRARRPEELHEIMAVQAAEPAPFPTVLYSSPAAISGNQLYHTAAILMLQNMPSSVRLSSLAGLAQPPQPPRSILWHARQICGISLTNHHHGAWTNSIQPLWIAGRCMSHISEHRAILDLMRRIQRESGWAAQWRADDLVEVWGEL